ncbi:unnamed protein product [Vicia faba]|uniref:BHLH domain-containing protein n=1 Tax=Vicia faba TaxID=3906 RepID=A0AAV1B820_VICFA|nr:unnamed protein product [Vicia faba]
MSMSVDRDQYANADLMWKNQSWGDVTNSQNLGESNTQKLSTKSINQKCGINEGEVLVNKKRSRGGVVIRTENNITNEKEKDGKYRNSNKELHILNERDRRKKMKNLFANLHALLPELPSKADKSSIVDAAVEKIINLKQVFEQLENKKQEKLKSVSKFGTESSFMRNSHLQPFESREAIAADQISLSYNNNFPTSIMEPPPQKVAFNTWSFPNVVLNVCGDVAQFCICATKKSCFLTTISFILEKYRIDVVSAHIMFNENGRFYMIHIQAKQGSLDISSMEKIYNQAAREIMAWIS